MGSISECILKRTAMIAGEIQNPKGLAARAKAVFVLGGTGIQGIDFKIPGARVSTSLFTGVFKEVLLWRILVGEWNSKVDGYKTNAAAMYNHQDDKMYVDLQMDSESLASVIHESVHAAHDIAADRLMTVLTTETAAYIAECVWKLKNQSVEYRTITSGSHKGDKSDKIYDAAWVIAEKNLARGAFSGKAPQSEFDELDLTPLTEAVKLVYTDWKDKVGFNGLTSTCG